MSDFEFVFGPAYSGKSQFVFKGLDSSLGTTAILFSPPEIDAAMQSLFLQSSNWKKPQQLNFELNPQNLPQTFQLALQNSHQIIVDGINLWCVQELIKASKLYSNEHLIEHIQTVVRDLLKKMRSFFDESSGDPSGKKIVFISNEVGAGVAPERALDRVFRLVLSQINQLLAENSDRCKYIVAGLPIHLK